MREAEIPKIKDMILEILGETCEKIILFGSYAYGTPQEESDIDIYVALKDGSKTPFWRLKTYMSALENMNFMRLMSLRIINHAMNIAA